MEYYNNEMDPQLDTNQPTLPSDYSQMEYYNKERNPQLDKAQLIISSKYSLINYFTQDTNPQVNTNPRTVTNAYKNPSFVGRNPYQPLTRVNEVDEEPPQNFNRNQYHLDSVENFINGETKYVNTKALEQMHPNISSINQNELQSETFQSKTFFICFVI
ncbi:hypothetical protein TNCT_188071 [Trichonephila clavata]|uniref:Uncharacterized protein n=1 Tax=Trichonephila clavata TaxID=2740835 RepID=A0A8X6LNF5_TRICU|nr:hypothetical protein TNCT_188071 [Trichonephila clavata]